MQRCPGLAHLPQLHWLSRTVATESSNGTRESTVLLSAVSATHYLEGPCLPKGTQTC
jgi:hypothetical protein